MNREDVNDFVRHNPIDDTVRPTNDFTNGWIWKLFDHPAEVRKVSQRIDGADQATDHNLRVGRGIALDECLRRRKVSLGPFGPMQRGHARKRFLTSS